MEIILSIVVVTLKILNYVDVILQTFGIKLYSITKEALLQGLLTNILIFTSISKSSYFLTEVDVKHASKHKRTFQKFIKAIYHFTINEVQTILAYC